MDSTLLRRKNATGKLGEDPVIGFNNVCERGGGVAIRALFGTLVELCDMVRKRIDQRPVQLAVLSERIEQQRLIKTTHHDDPIERRPLIDKPDLSGHIAPNPAQVQVERGGRAAVQRQLSRTSGMPLLGGRKIEIREFNRALQLVGAIAGEKDNRNVSLDAVDPIDARPVCERPSEKSDHRVLVVGFRPAGGGH